MRRSIQNFRPSNGQYQKKIFIFILWCFTGAKHLGTRDLSGKKKSSEALLQIVSRFQIFFFRSPFG